MTTAAFDPLRALRVLADHGVDYVMIGGLAARLWGSPSVTNDLDLCYDRSPENLERLAAALRELQATLRGAPEGLPFLLDAKTLKQGDSFTFNTVAGAFDLLGTPSGSDGYGSLALNAREMDLGDMTVRVADLRDLIRMKKAAGRPKDLIEVEILSALLEEREGQWP
jgi:hypothetical protein